MGKPKSTPSKNSGYSTGKAGLQKTKKFKGVPVTYNEYGTQKQPPSGGSSKADSDRGGFK